MSSTKAALQSMHEDLGFIPSAFCNQRYKLYRGPLNSLRSPAPSTLGPSVLGKRQCDCLDRTVQEPPPPKVPLGEACLAGLPLRNTDPNASLYLRMLWKLRPSIGPCQQTQMAPVTTCIPLRPSITCICSQGLAMRPAAVRKQTSQFWSSQADPEGTWTNPHLCFRFKLQR